jgi:hypothetical protein
MKAILTEIKIDYDVKFSEQELETLKKYSPQSRFKTIDDFRPWQGDEEEKMAIAKQKFEEYIVDERKALKSTDTFVCDLQLFMHDFPHMKFSVIGSRETIVEPNNIDAIAQHQHFIDSMVQAQEQRMKTMMDSFLKMSENIVENLKADTLNQKCDVHIGGGLLLTVNETMLLEDSCTDRLQSELNSGWRILAVCVQPDGRRPDYVLGRFNPDLNVGGSAAR